MRQLLFFTVFSLFWKVPLAQNDTLQRESIIYMLPGGIDAYLEKGINSQDSIFFYLCNSGNQYLVYAVKLNENDPCKEWVKSTTRELMLNKTFYPLIFDHDLEFSAFRMSNSPLGRLIKAKRKLGKDLIANRAISFVKFTLDGKVLESSMR